jgi:hypothetical protein
VRRGDAPCDRLACGYGARFLARGGLLCERLDCLVDREEQLLLARKCVGDGRVLRAELRDCPRDAATLSP